MNEYGCCVPVEKISRIREMGYDFCELSGKEIMSYDDDWNRVRDEILGTGLPVRGFNAFCSADLPMIGHGASIDKQRDYAKEIVRRGKELGIRTIGVGAPAARKLEADFPKETADRQMIRFLQILCDEAGKAGIDVLLEALHPWSCNYCNRISEAGRLVTEADRTNLFLVYDVYHSVLGNDSLFEVMEAMPLVKHVHICSWERDTRKRHFLKEQDSAYAALLQKFLRDAGYEGGISIEANAAEVEREGISSLKILKTTRT